MSEYFFRGSMSQFWGIVYGEYQHFHTVLGRKPFEFNILNISKDDLAEYAPQVGDLISIEIWNDAHSCLILSVDAEFEPDRELVQVMVFFHDHLDALHAFSRASGRIAYLMDMQQKIFPPLEAVRAQIREVNNKMDEVLAAQVDEYEANGQEVPDWLQELQYMRLQHLLESGE